MFSSLLLLRFFRVRCFTFYIFLLLFIRMFVINYGVLHIGIYLSHVQVFVAIYIYLYFLYLVFA